MKVWKLEGDLRRKRGGGFAETRQMFFLTSEMAGKFVCFEEMQIALTVEQQAGDKKNVKLIFGNRILGGATLG